MALRLKKGDTVKILTGKDRSKTGKILDVFAKNGTVVVEGINLVTRHRRPRRTKEKGQKVIKPSPIQSSNLILICSNCAKPTRVKLALSEQGQKSRICRHCGKTI